MHPIRIIMLVLSVLAALVALPLFGLAMLGFAGIAADVSLAENRQIGVTFLGYAALFGIPAALLLVAARPFKRDR